MTHRQNNVVYKVVVILWLTLSIGSVVLAGVSWAQLSTRLMVGRQVTVMREEMDAILKNLLDAETAARGYVITGDKKFLEPLAGSPTNLSGHFDHIVDAAAGRQQVLKDLNELRAEAATIAQWQEELVRARDADFNKARIIMASGHGKELMDAARTKVEQMNNANNVELSSIRQEIRQHLSQANITSLVAGVIGIIAGVFAFWLARLTLMHQERERELVEARLHAERGSREKTIFLANMSHEIRTPMNAILGFSELLQGELKDSRQRQYIQSIHNSAGSLLLLINDILDMSKIEAGVMTLNPEPTDLREVCDFVHTLFSEPAAKKNLKLECHLAENFPAALLMDRIRLRQILINLVGNAVKFTDHGGIEVRVQWEKQPATSRVTLVIEVQDTGVGIPQDRLDAIFKPFVQAGANRDKEKAGTGLGLSIVKRLTETMGGSVTVASVSGQGSAFHVRFPDVPISARLPASGKPGYNRDADFNQLHPAKLLVVDDNETNCQLIAGIFEGSHHHLFFGSSGGEAVSRCRELKPDILLLDVRMPGMDGYEAVEEIRKIPGLEFLPIIAVTASSLPPDEKMLKERFSGFVRKPFSRRELFDELADFLPAHSTEVPPLAVTGKAADAVPAPAPPVSKELITQLHRLMIDPWPSIRDSVAINESKVFAQGLEGLGQRWQCEPLVIYAQKILHDAENYAATDLEKHLGEFSALVGQLEKTGC